MFFRGDGAATVYKGFEMATKDPVAPALAFFANS
jgi:hypothetical protein